MRLRSRADIMHFFVDGSSATANIVKKLMETVMKKLLIILSLVFICALLSAMDLDDAVTDIYSTGNLSSIGGDNYWVSEGYLASEDDAYNYVAYVASLFVYIKADWDTPSSASRESEIKSVEYVSAYWYDTEEEIEYMISLSMDDVMNEFETEESYEMDFNDLVDELLEFAYYFAEETAY